MSAETNRSYGGLSRTVAVFESGPTSYPAGLVRCPLTASVDLNLSAAIRKPADAHTTAMDAGARRTGARDYQRAHGRRKPPNFCEPHACVEQRPTRAVVLEMLQSEATRESDRQKGLERRHFGIVFRSERYSLRRDHPPRGYRRITPTSWLP